MDVASRGSPGRGDTETWLPACATISSPATRCCSSATSSSPTPTSDRLGLPAHRSRSSRDAANDRTRVTWKRGLGRGRRRTPIRRAQPQVHVLRKRAAVFGAQRAAVAQACARVPAPTTRQYPAHAITRRSGPASRYPGRHDDRRSRRSRRGLARGQAGGYAVLTRRRSAGSAASASCAKGGFNSAATSRSPSGTHVELYRIDSTAEVSRAEFALSGKVTRLQLHGAELSTQFSRPRARNQRSSCNREPLTFADYPVTTAVSGDQRAGRRRAPTDLLPGRRLHRPRRRAQRRRGRRAQATLVAAHAIDAGRCTLEIAPPLPAALERDSVVVHAQRRARLARRNGDADPRRAATRASAFQRFELKQLPLTYRARRHRDRRRERAHACASTTSHGPSGRRCSAPRPPSAPTRSTTDEQGRDFVVFGDGVRGARLPSGVNNVRATYRKGLGRDGNVAADKLTQLTTRPLGLKSVSNPVAAEGGTDPEPAEPRAPDDAARHPHARPRGVAARLRRLRARVQPASPRRRRRCCSCRPGRPIAITVAGPGRRGAVAGQARCGPTCCRALKAERRSARRGAAAVLPGQHVPPRPEGQARSRPTKPRPCLRRSKRRLRAHYAFDIARSLGQPVQQSDVIAVAQAVPGVVAVDLDAALRRHRTAGADRCVAADAAARLAHARAAAAWPSRPSC